MTMKEKLLVVALLVVVTSGFLFGHFWSYTIYLVQKAVAFGIFPLLLGSKFVAGLLGAHALI